MRPYYDYVIVGSGPAGLALAQTLRHTEKSILIIDAMEEIGGCHRVVRVPYEGTHWFTEHGPRIYVSNYKNFQYLLEDMGQDFFSLFTPYRYSMRAEMFKRMKNLSYAEWRDLSGAFLLFLADENYGKKGTIEQFGKKHKFTPNTMDLLDRLARMTDGAGADRYTMNMLFQLINQSFMYRIYEPRSPNDVGLFRIWKQFLEQQSNIDFLLQHEAVNLGYNSQLNEIESVWVVDQKNHNTIEIKCHNVILAVPPHAIARVLKTCHDSVKNSFMPYRQLETLVSNTDYIPYISMTLHWKTKQDKHLPPIHGFPVGEWGVIFIVLSDYMDMSKEPSKTLVSCGISYLDRPSNHTGKTANQSAPEEVIEETFRQLSHVFPHLSKPDVALISPQNKYHPKEQKWTQYDVSYFSSGGEKPMKTQGSVRNLYNVGTQNRNSLIGFTTLESAVSNAISLSHQLDPRTKELYPLQKFWTLRDIVFLLSMTLLFIMAVIVGIVLWKTKPHTFININTKTNNKKKQTIKKKETINK